MPKKKAELEDAQNAAVMRTYLATLSVIRNSVSKLKVLRLRADEDVHADLTAEILNLEYQRSLVDQHWHAFVSGTRAITPPSPSLIAQVAEKLSAVEKQTNDAKIVSLALAASTDFLSLFNAETAAAA